MNKLSDLINFHKGDVASIVGSGGKTTTMLSLARELCDNSKVLATTSTKIYYDSPLKNEYVFSGVDDFISNNKNSNGLYIFGKETLDNKKFSGICDDDIDRIKSFFEYIIIEADGCKNMPLKGWRDFEPVILKQTTHTIGVIPITALGKPITDALVFHRELFERDFGKFENMSFETYLNIINSNNGIFKITKGRRIFFLNQVDNKQSRIVANELISYLINSGVDEDIVFIYGSAMNKDYHIYSR